MCKLTAQLIVNADDAGLSRGVNEAIVAGARRGVITAASLMPVMPFAAEAVTQFAQEVPHLDLGLHVCLTSGRSVAPPKDMLRHSFLSLLMRSRQKSFLAQIKTEITAQLAWCDAHNVKLQFIDGHQHIHVIPGIAEIVVEIAQQRKLYVRLPNEPIGSMSRLSRRWRSWLARGGVGLAKKMLLSFLSKRLERSGTASPFVYHGILDTGRMTLAAWESILQSPHIHGATLLVNVHPACRCELENASLSRDDIAFVQSTDRQSELETLMDESFAALCRNNNIKLVRFSEI